MQPFFSKIIRRCKGSSTRTFILFPILVLAWELLLNKGTLRFNPIFLPLLAWGYLQYRLCGRYRIRHGGGGPGMDTPPERLVTSGPYAYTRNPMYIGHLIFLSGMALTFRSWLALALAVMTAIFLHARILRDERRLSQQFGDRFDAYYRNVKRWMPGLF